MNQRPALLLVGLAYLAFIGLGLPDGLLGVAWPSIRAYFSLPLDALGALLGALTAGYLLSSFSSGHLIAHLRLGLLLSLSCLAAATSLLGYALAPAWLFMVALAFLAGLAGGAIDAGLNTYVATYYSARTLNWLHASFGLGAAIGPVVMTSVLAAGRPWQLGYAVVGAAQLGLAVCFLLTRTWWDSARTNQEAASESQAQVMPLTNTLRLPMAWLSMALFFIYTGVEVTAGQWSFSLLTLMRGVPEYTAGVWIAVYWGSLTAGRIAFGAIVNVMSLKLLLRLCLASIVTGVALIALDVSDSLTFFGLAITGFTLAPLFPSLIATTSARMGSAHTANAVGFQVAAAVVGGAVLPGLVGLLAEQLSLEVLGPFLLVAAFLLLVLYEITSRHH